MKLELWSRPDIGRYIRNPTPRHPMTLPRLCLKKAQWP